MFAHLPTRVTRKLKTAAHLVLKPSPRTADSSTVNASTTGEASTTGGASTKKKPKDLLSIVVPAYNVEAYLGECLDSILKQTYSTLEIIIIVDGATDGTHSVASQYAERDSRIQVHHQENSGLSAARNTGASKATGTYLWFVDSDDKIPPKAAAALVGSLTKTNSDIAVGCYNRFNSKQSWQAGHWIRDLHAKQVHGLRVDDDPSILVNAVAWSKVYSTRFWRENDLSFPVGVTYEDQPVSARAYARAEGIDVVSDVVYHWRERDDQSSISQQSMSCTDLDARMVAAETSLKELYDGASAEVATERAVQLLANDMQHSMRHLVDTDTEFWERLAAGISAIAAYVPQNRWRDVPPQHAALEWLLLKREFGRVSEYLEQDGRNVNASPATRVEEDFVLQVPHSDDPEVAYPTEVLRLLPMQTEPAVALRRAHWAGPGKLVIEGWAYLHLVAPDQIECPANLYLVSNEPSAHVVRVPLGSYPDSDVDRISRHQVNDYRPFGFRGIIDVDALDLRSLPKTSYTLSFEFVAGPITHETHSVNVLQWGSAGYLPANTSAEGAVASLRYAKDSVHLDVRQAAVTATSVEQKRDAVRLVVDSARALSSIRISALTKAGGSIIDGSEVDVPVSDNETNSYIAILRESDIPDRAVNSWLVRAIGTDGKRYAIAWATRFHAPLLLAEPGRYSAQVVLRTAAGNMGLGGVNSRVHVENAVLVDGGVQLSGCVLGNKLPTTIRMTGPRVDVECPLTITGPPFRFYAHLPWHATQFGRTFPLPPGDYEYEFLNGGDRFPMSVSEELGAKLPLWMDKTADIVGRFEVSPKAYRPKLKVEATLNADEWGARNKRALRDAHIHGDYEIDKQAVLFRAYYGECTSGNLLAIHEELRRTRSGMKLYWTVSDSSVDVPEGGIPVVANSRRWFELLSSAGYIVDNNHQPDFFTKRSGQIVVATFHGYPFKMNGMPYWERERWPQHRIDSFLRRQQQWDYLVSPAPYATPLLERVFPTPATVLEVGYPRNDVFFSENRHAIRARTRRGLGISDDKTVVLYAPTFRDNLKLSEMKASWALHLDLEKACEALGNGYVILVRGHAFNLRAKESLPSTPEQVIDVTAYPDIAELCLASDVGVLDYSSLRFDYTLTGNPTIFLVPDLEQYRDGLRGCLVPFEDTAPGPFTRDSEDVIECLKDVPALRRRNARLRRRFLNEYMPLEDGRAAERLVSQVFEGSDSGHAESLSKSVEGEYHESGA